MKDKTRSIQRPCPGILQRMQQNISASLDIAARPILSSMFPDNQHARRALSLRTATMSTIYRDIIRFGFGQSPFVIED